MSSRNDRCAGPQENGSGTMAMTDRDVNIFYEKLHRVLRSSKLVAYRYFNERHDYRELYSMMLKINSALAGLEGECVVTYTDKSVSAYGAIYSILLSGNIWVPLSLEMPETRAAEILGQVSPKIILSNVAMPGALNDHIRENGIRVEDLERLASSASERSFKDTAFKKDDIAYIMFTSGSTGVPKGVPMTHENYINFVNNCMDILPFRKNDIFSDYHDFAFDISVFYLFCCPLNEGAFAPVKNNMDRMIPLRFMQQNGVTIWSSVPSAISRIKSLNKGAAAETAIRVMFLCGEPFSLNVLRYCLENMKIPDTYNFYGLTETGVENFYHRCLAGDPKEYEEFGFVPIGRPLAGNNILVGEDKELLLSGCQITPGYLGGAGGDRFEVIDGTRWFHTGDIVEEHKGVYFCKGRVDSQIKIRGYRVEPMDIEVHMKRFPGVEEAVCFAKEKGSKKMLIGVIRPSPGCEPALEALRAFIASQLPHYMVPGKIFTQNEIPVNRNGKIDRGMVKKLYENM